MLKQRKILKLKAQEERKGGKGKKKKADRWKKGHSCESNPTVRKFRDGASNLHFPLHSVGSNPLLTVGNLGTNRDDDMESEYDVLSEDVQSLTVSDARSFLGGSQSSVKTFASGWSKCTNRAFERFLGRFKVDSSLHKEMLSILAATTEVISSMGGKQTETEYFASFISTLEKCEPNQCHPMIALLCMIIGKVPESVIKYKFEEIYPKVSTIFTSAIEANEHSLIRLCCDALGKILRVNDNIIVDRENPDNYSAYYSILKCCLHENPKVRRKARQVIGGLLNKHNEKQSTNLSKLVLGWILDQLGAYPTCGPKTVCDTLSLLQFVWNFVETITTSASKKIFEAVLRVMSGGDTGIVKIGLLFFSNVFQKGVGLSAKNEEQDSLTLKLVTVLWDLRPDWRNNEAFICWLRCLLDGALRLQNEEDTSGQKYIPMLVEAVSLSWPSSFGRQTSQIFSDYLEHLITSETSTEVIEELFKILSKHLIAIPPNPNCLMVLEALLDTLSPNNYGQASREVLLQLVPLYGTNTGEVCKTLGMFVKAFGVENLWNSVDPETRRAVILPLLRENLCKGSFNFWKDNILPYFLHSSSSEVMQLAVWDAFVGFCRDPSTMDGFPAELVGKTVVTKPAVRLAALSGLRQLGQWDVAHPMLTKYSKNYIPLLFNLYIKETVKSTKLETKLENPGHAEAVLQTIREYLKFCDKNFIKDLLIRAITNLTTGKDTSDEERTPLLDLVATLAYEHVDAELFSKLMEVATQYIDEASQQKRAYRILVSLVKNEDVTEELRETILSLIRSKKGKAKSNAEALRLECLNLLIEKDPSLINEFLPEAVLNLLSVNTKSRKLAIHFSKKACEHLKTIESMMEMIQIGLKSTNAFVRACTINFITLAFLELKPKEPNAILIQACIDQIVESKQTEAKPAADGSPRKEALGFISLNLSLFKSLMGPYTGAIGQVLSLPGNPRQEVNKILARMIKVFGVAGLRAVLPTANEPKMHIRIRNLQKKIRKMQEAKKLGKKSRDDGDEDDEDREDKSGDESNEDELVGTAKTSRRTLSKRGLIMKEGVVDFLDPKTVTGAVISKPKESKGGDQFKLSEDGRLIIEMEEEMEKTGAGQARKRKSGLSDYSTGADSDEDDDADDADHCGKKYSRDYDNRSTKSSRSFRSSKSKSSRVSDSSRRSKIRPKRARF